MIPLTRLIPNIPKKVNRLRIDMTKTPHKETCVFLMSSSLEESVLALNNPLLSDNQFRYYYQDKFISMDKVPNKVIIDNISDYDNISNKTNKKPILNIKQIKDNNYFYNIFNNINIILNNNLLNSNINKINYFYNYLNTLINNINNKEFKNILLLIPFNKNNKREYNNNSINDIIDLLYLSFKLNIINKDFINNKKFNIELILLLPDNTICKLDFKNEKSYNKIKSVISGLDKYVNSLPMSIEDEINLQDNDFVKPAISDNGSTSVSELRENAKYYTCLTSQIHESLKASAKQPVVLYTTPLDALNAMLSKHSNYPITAGKDNKITFSGLKIPKKVSVGFKEYDIGVFEVSNTSKIQFTEESIPYVKNETDISLVEDIDSIFSVRENTVDTQVLKDAVVEETYSRLKQKLITNFGSKSLNGEERSLLADLYHLIDERYSTSLSVDDNIKAISTDPEVLGIAASLKDIQSLSVADKKRNDVINELSSRQNNAIVNIDGKQRSLREILDDDNTPVVRQFNIDTVNESLKTSFANDINHNYNENDRVQDILSIASNFAEAEDTPIFVSNIEINDSSDASNLTDDVKITFNVPNRKPLITTVTVPKPTNDGYVFLNGSKKFVTNQIIQRPIVKIKMSGEDVVQFTSDYNKVIISRIGKKGSSANTRSIKLFKDIFTELGSKFTHNGTISEIRLGTNADHNTIFMSSLDFDEFSEEILFFKNKDLYIETNRIKANKLAEDGGYDLEDLTKSRIFPIGTIGSNLLVSNSEGVLFSANKRSKALTNVANTLSDLVRDHVTKYIPTDIASKLNGYSVGKRFSYSSIKVANKKIPLIVFNGYKQGLFNVLDAYNVNYITNDKSKHESSSFETIKFSDGFLHFEATSPSVRLLVNGLSALETSKMEFKDLDSKGNGYGVYFSSIDTPNLGKALDNFYVLFLDPMTKSTLRSLGQPDELMDCILYCNDLLQNPHYSRRNDMSNYRIRGMESLNSTLYKVIADSVRRFRNSANSAGSSVTLSVKKDSVLKELAQSPIVEDLPLLNPVRETQNRTKVTFKGIGGSNFNHAKGTEEIRAYDKSMVGVLAPVSTDDAGVGITRQLVMNPRLKGKRGIIDTDINISELNASEILSTGELLSPYTAQHSDPPRQGMEVRQTMHQLPTLKQHKSLVTSDADQSVMYTIGNDFVYKARLDGVVEKVDTVNDLIIVRYSDGSKGAIDLSDKHGRAPDGYYSSIKLEHKLKKGQKFKANDILAFDKHFFNAGGTGIVTAPTMTKGRLSSVAIACLDVTFEDSTVITNETAEDMGSEISFMRTASISASANISKYAKKGDSVKSSDSLVVFEETFNDDSGDVGKLLDKLGSDFEQGISEYSKSVKPAKYTGVISDFRLYYNKEISEFSPSIQKMLKSYFKAAKAKLDVLDGTSKGDIVNVPIVEKVDGDKILGEDIDGLLMVYFIKTVDKFTVGDKLTVSKALKSISAEVLPDGLEPFVKESDGTRFKQDLVVSPLSTSSRMVQDFYMELWTNGGIIALKENIRDLMK